MQYYIVRHKNTNALLHTEPNLTKHEAVLVLNARGITPADYYVTEWCGDGTRFDDDTMLRRIDGSALLVEDRIEQRHHLEGEAMEKLRNIANSVSPFIALIK